MRLSTRGRTSMSQEAQATALACSQCGRVFAHSDLVQIAGTWVCADCKPAFLSRVMASGAADASPQARHYGGFWIRWVARFVDNIVLGVPVVIFAILLIPNLFSEARTSQPGGAFAAVGLT